MGLISNIFGKKSNFEGNLKKAYYCFKPEMVDTIFLGGIDQARKIVLSISKILNEDAKSYDALKCYEILKLFVTVLTRKVITQSDDAKIKASLLVKGNGIITNKNVENIFAFIVLSINNPEFELLSEADFDVLNTISGYQSYADNAVLQNENITYNSTDEQYGIVLEKPIYVNGIRGSEKYLSSLRTVLNEKLTWSRIGSFSTEAVNGVIDSYEMYLPSGKLYKTIYICMYAKQNSTVAPKGFHLEV